MNTKRLDCSYLFLSKAFLLIITTLKNKENCNIGEDHPNLPWFVVLGMEHASLEIVMTQLEGSMDPHKKTKSEWLVILLIILFFAIPVCAMAVISDPVNMWPRHPTSFVYNLVLK